MKMGWRNAKTTVYRKPYTGDKQEAETKIDENLTVKPRNIT
jgi:hypothetical protein